EAALRPLIESRGAMIMKKIMKNRSNLYAGRRFAAVVTAAAMGASAALTLAAEPAEGTTINFAPLTQLGVGFNYIGTTYSQNGFTFNRSAGPFGDLFGALAG